MNKNCIVVPVYKEFIDLTKNELISLSQLYNILGKHKIFIIGPDTINWNNYLLHAKEVSQYPNVEYFSNYFFTGIKGYNDLLTSLDFYSRFQNFKYLLIYQLDAFVFRDELKYWSNKGYDYIGAPWFEGWHKATKSSEIIGVGNGGFSLRNVQTSISLLKRINIIKKLRRSPINLALQKFLKTHRYNYYFNKFFKIRNTRSLDLLLNDEYTNEDYKWTQIIADAFLDYKVSPVSEAMKFSYDANPSLLFELNNYQLPFGCHAWERYEPEFWYNKITMKENL